MQLVPEGVVPLLSYEVCEDEPADRGCILIEPTWVSERANRSERALLRVQGMARALKFRLRYKALRHAALVLQRAWRALKERRRVRYATRVQAMRRYRRFRRAVVVLQSGFRRMLARCAFRHLRRCAVRIQAAIRGALARIHFAQLCRAHLPTLLDRLHLDYRRSQTPLRQRAHFLYHNLLHPWPRQLHPFTLLHRLYGELCRVAQSHPWMEPPCPAGRLCPALLAPLAAVFRRPIVALPVAEGWPEDPLFTNAQLPPPKARALVRSFSRMPSPSPFVLRAAVSTAPSAPAPAPVTIIRHPPPLLATAATATAAARPASPGLGGICTPVPSLTPAATLPLPISPPPALLHIPIPVSPRTRRFAHAHARWAHDMVMVLFEGAPPVAARTAAAAGRRLLKQESRLIYESPFHTHLSSSSHPPSHPPLRPFQLLKQESKLIYESIRTALARGLFPPEGAPLYRAWGIDPKGRRRKGQLVGMLFGQAEVMSQSAELVTTLLG
ncbi:hypothetical protein PAPYR_8614 [Paratrimastix pyriformis]|uniref:Uncharacterized protein n=1 Tax=Paratrimastix pyriformis TaxID=342808 RepID=A0ABQ8UFS5_9EUKA|nr:hypothetical protein PAPYR_8614 [Paratrimastix pyriformis]